MSLRIEVLDLSGVGSGWSLSDYSSSEKKKLEKEKVYYSFNNEKEFMEFVRLEASINFDDDIELNTIQEGALYLEELNYEVNR